MNHSWLPIVQTMRRVGQWALFATTPAIALLAFTSLEKALIALNYLGTQGLLLLYLNRRTGILSASHTESPGIHSRDTRNKRPYTDILAFSVILGIALLSYAQALRGFSIAE